MSFKKKIHTLRNLNRQTEKKRVGTQSWKKWPTNEIRARIGKIQVLTEVALTISKNKAQRGIRPDSPVNLLTYSLKVDNQGITTLIL